MFLNQQPDELLNLPKGDVSYNPLGDYTNYSNYSTPTSTDKINEAATKLSNTGEIRKFDTLTKGVELSKINGDIIATDAATGQQLSNALASDDIQDVAAVQDNNRPEDKTIQQRVKITQMPSVGKIQEVTFLNMPTIQESRDAQYKNVDIAHHPGEILKYVNTGTRSWTIQTKLTSRNTAEATLNLNYINVIRSWLMPFYGNGASDPNLTQYLGAPPPILTLTAYGNQMIGPVPCILINYGWTFPNDCDYIPTDDGSPFPVVLDVTIQLKESFSPAEYSSFDLSSFKRGDMKSAYSGGGIYSNVSNKGATTPAEVNKNLDEAQDYQRPSASSIPSGMSLKVNQYLASSMPDTNDVLL